MNDGTAGLNTLVVKDHEHLLVDVGAGSAVHMVPNALAGAMARSAVPDSWLDDTWLPEPVVSPRYDRTALSADRWAPKTLCGREWLGMVGGEAGPVHAWDETEALAPTCRACLAAIDRLFPDPEPDDRIETLSALVADAVSKHGEAHVHHVPGDQMPLLRKAARQAIRQKLGYTSNTHVLDDLLIVYSAQAAEPLHQQHMDQAGQLMEAIIRGERPSLDTSDWKFSWHAWG